MCLQTRKNNYSLPPDVRPNGKDTLSDPGWVSGLVFVTQTQVAQFPKRPFKGPHLPGTRAVDQTHHKGCIASCGRCRSVWSVLHFFHHLGVMHVLTNILRASLRRFILGNNPLGAVRRNGPPFIAHSLLPLGLEPPPPIISVTQT